jgi:hypothetical protein
MKWREIISENEQRLLYHGTSMTGFTWIANSNSLDNNGGEEQVSFSRNADVARHFTQSAIGLHHWGQLSLTDRDHDDLFSDNRREDGEWLAYRAEMAGGGKGVVFCLDWAKLAQDYEVESVDFGAGNDEEEEEAVFQTIQNLSAYLVRIEIDHAGFQKYCEVVAAEGNDSDRARMKHAVEWVRRYA